MSSVRKSPTIVRRSSTTPPAEKEAGLQQSLALEKPAANDEPLRSKPTERLWLCIYLPALSLEALESFNSGGDVARAVFEDQEGVPKVLLASREAMLAGIAPGLSVNAALALLPDLELEERDPPLEQQSLLNLAAWAEQFTSSVAVEAPDVLLLELAGSLRLFGGLKALRERISTELGQQGYTAGLSIAPTPLAATWLARAGRRACVRDKANLTGALSNLPLHCLDWPQAAYELLNGMGISRVGDCLRLPRQGFAKRFGASRLLELDRATGRLPDPRVSYRSPERFSAERELIEELSDSQLILHACEELLRELERFLLTRQLTVQRITFSFFHLQHAATHLPLGCVQPDRAVHHWIDLLGIRFERLELPAAVIAVRLCAGQGQVVMADSGALPFNKKDRQCQNLSIQHLVERLGARIGGESVHGVVTVAEHRPHYAWRRESTLDRLPSCQATPNFWYECDAPELLADIRRTNSLLLRRPLWMLPQPELLVMRDDKPVYQGVLQLINGPERLETGWWDEEGIARDYFVALNPAGVRLWIFRNRNKQGDWFLHGVFG